MDFSIDAPCTVNFEGKNEPIKLSTAITLSALLLDRDKPFSVKGPDKEIYIEYDGNQVYTDRRIQSIIEEVSLVFRKDD